MTNNNKTISEFLQGKSAVSIELFNCFKEVYDSIGMVELRAAKTMIGICSPHRTIAWATHFGKNFVHIVFTFQQPYHDNLCFVKIAQVPGDDKQFNHHFRMISKDDINEEVKGFMALAYFRDKV